MSQKFVAERSAIFPFSDAFELDFAHASVFPIPVFKAAWARRALFGHLKPVVISSFAALQLVSTNL
jgi:hypothetical protein